MGDLIAALQSEQAPGAGGPPVEVVIGVTSAANRVTFEINFSYLCGEPLGIYPRY